MSHHNKIVYYEISYNTCSENKMNDVYHTTPSQTRPRHTAYYRMPTKPRVPSIGSKTQNVPDGPPWHAPRSVRKRTCATMK